MAVRPPMRLPRQWSRHVQSGILHAISLASVVVSFALGLLAWLVGAALLATPFLRGRVRPRWVGYVLPASALWMAVGTAVIAPGGPASNLALNLLSNLGPVLLLFALGYLGLRAWTAVRQTS